MPWKGSGSTASAAAGFGSRSLAPPSRNTSQSRGPPGGGGGQRGGVEGRADAVAGAGDHGEIVDRAEERQHVAIARVAAGVRVPARDVEGLPVEALGQLARGIGERRREAAVGERGRQ